jgi:hypothetical protein
VLEGGQSEKCSARARPRRDVAPARAPGAPRARRVTSVSGPAGACSRGRSRLPLGHDARPEVLHAGNASNTEPLCVRARDQQSVPRRPARARPKASSASPLVTRGSAHRLEKGPRPLAATSTTTSWHAGPPRAATGPPRCATPPPVSPSSVGTPVASLAPTKTRAAACHFGLARPLPEPPRPLQPAKPSAGDP